MKKEVVENIDFKRLTPELILELVEKYKHESSPYTIILNNYKIDKIYAIKTVNSYNINTGMAYIHIIDINGKYMVINESFVVLIEHNDSIEKSCDNYNKLIDEAEVFYNTQNDIAKNDTTNRDVS